jgi:hypothetical protein
MRYPAFLTALWAPVLFSGQVRAAAFERPIPNPQSATAELWFAAASVGLLLALAAVHWLVARR